MPKYSTIGGLNSEELKKVQRILGDCENLERAQIFGSRAMNTHKPSSDVDLALFGEHLSRLDVNALKIAFEDSPLPHTFDLILHRTIKEPELLAHIQRRGMDVYREGFYLSDNGEWVPDGWTNSPLNQVVSDFIDYRGKTPKKTNSGIPLITAKVVKEGRVLQTEEFINESEYEAWMRRGIPKDGDVILTTEAPLGEVAFIPKGKIALAQRIITLRGKTGKLDNGFLKYSLQSPLMQYRLTARESGSTVSGIKSSELKVTDLLHPEDLNEQVAIASVLRSLDNKIELLREQNETLEALAQTLFKRWFIDFNFPCLLAYSERTQADYPELGIYGHSDFGGLPQPEQGSSAPNGQAVKCFVYVLRLENGNRYVGLTDFLLRRYHEHKTGQGAKATKASQPVAIIHFETFDSREAAAEREQWLKTGFGRKWLDREEEKGNLGAYVMQAPMIASELGEIPAGWRVSPLYDLAKYINGAAFKPSHFSKDGSGLAVIKIAELKSGISNQTKFCAEEMPKKVLIKSGDILFSWSGSPEETSIDSFIWVGNDALLNQHIFKVADFLLSKGTTYFLLKYLKPLFINIAKQKQTTGLGHVTVADLKEQALAIPKATKGSLDYTIFEDLFDKLVSNSQQIDTLTELRDTLLPKLIRGEVRVTA